MKDALSKTKPSAAKAKSSAARLQRVRDLRLVVCLLLTAAVGLCVLLFGGPAEGAEGSLSVGWKVFVYLFGCTIAIAALYFHYSFCCLHNAWHRVLHESGGAEGEPSALALVMMKMAGWFLFLFAQAIAFVPALRFLLFS